MRELERFDVFLTMGLDFYKDYLYLCSSVRALESSTPSAFRSLFFDTGQKQIPYTYTIAQVISEMLAEPLRPRRSLFFDAGQKQIPSTCTIPQAIIEISAEQLRLSRNGQGILIFLRLKLKPVQVKDAILVV
jgi:hypothetical protein